VCDVDTLCQQQAQAAGAQVLDTPESAARSLAADGVLVVCVVDAAQTRDVLLGERGAIAALRPGQTVMLCPTIAPMDTEVLAATLADAGIDCIDAPMSGGPARAREGSMSLMVATPDAVFQRHAVLLSTLSNQVFRISEHVGDGARTKLVNNLLAGINLVGAAEALALAERLGLDLPTTLGVIEKSSGQSWIGSDRMQRALAGESVPKAHVSLLTKDTRLAVEAARQVGYVGPLGERVASAFAGACAAGLNDQDDSALLAFLRGKS
jgi:L-threonate 2-dehydrogenase